MLDKQEAAREVDDGLKSEQSPFYIAAAGSPSRPRCILKQNDCFAVLDSHGAIGCASDEAGGLFARDTRHLSRLAFLVNGQEPLLLGSTLRDDNLNLRADLTNPDILEGEGIALLKDTVHISRTIYIHNGLLCERSAVFNHGNVPVSLDVAMTSIAILPICSKCAAINGASRPSARDVSAARPTSPSVYMGLDGTERKTNIYFEPPPTQLLASAATYQLRLEVGKVLCIFMSVECLGSRLPERTNFLKGLVAANTRSPFGVAIRRIHRDFEQCAQRSALPRHGGSSDADHGDSGGIISLCRHPLVLHHLRSRWSAHGPTNALVRSTCRAGRPQRLAAYQATTLDALRGCRAGQDPARDAERRNGGLGRGALRSLLRKRQLHAAVRSPCLPLLRKDWGP